MKITNKQLRLLIKEELQTVLNENDNNLQKLATMLKSEDPVTFKQAVELTDALEPFHRAEIYDIIKLHAKELRWRIKRWKSNLRDIEHGIDPFAPLTDFKTVYEPTPEKLEWVAKLSEEGIRETMPRLLELEELLSKFKTKYMVYVDHQTME